MRKENNNDDADNSDYSGIQEIFSNCNEPVLHSCVAGLNINFRIISL